MKIVDTYDLLKKGSFVRSKDWKKANQNVREAILATDWPHNSGNFSIFPE